MYKPHCTICNKKAEYPYITLTIVIGMNRYFRSTYHKNCISETLTKNNFEFLFESSTATGVMNNV